MQLISFSFPSIPQVRCAFQTRRGGNSLGPYAQGNIAFNVGDYPLSVLRNRRQLLHSLNLEACSEVNQVHGDTILLNVESTPLNNPNLVEADGLATSMPGLGLIIKTADCQPILLASVDGLHIAALHVGWRGNHIGFIGKAVKEFCESRNISPRKLVAVRGPSLSPEKSEFINFGQEWGEEFLPWYNQETKTLDMWQLSHYQLLKAGLENSNIFSLDLCTYSREDLFFSYRRNKVTGRQASVIWIDYSDFKIMPQPS